MKPAQNIESNLAIPLLGGEEGAAKIQWLLVRGCIVCSVRRLGASTAVLKVYSVALRMSWQFPSICDGVYQHFGDGYITAGIDV